MQKLILIKNKVNEIINKRQLKNKPEIIVVTKTFSLIKFEPILKSGHLHFGENKLQEAENKWPEIKKSHKNLKLHMIGKLQSNKAKKAIKIFDYIHSLDSIKLATKIDQYQKELNKKVKLFIQVNIGNESQKAGILLNDFEKFYHYCTKNLSLDIIGLMCLPPHNLNSKEYFLTLKKLGNKFNLNDFSMGMSSDYEDALLSGSTYLRLGSAILGERVIT